MSKIAVSMGHIATFQSAQIFSLINAQTVLLLCCMYKKQAMFYVQIYNVLSMKFLWATHDNK